MLSLTKFSMLAFKLYFEIYVCALLLSVPSSFLSRQERVENIASSKLAEKGKGYLTLVTIT